MSDTSSKKTNDRADRNDAAVNLIRSKIRNIYGNEPSVKDEINEIKDQQSPLSKHQKFMKELSDSGKSLAEIQTLWHEYYQKLPDEEKHQVWQEFYATHQREKKSQKTIQDATTEFEHPPKKTHVYHEPDDKNPATKRNIAELKKQITKKASASNKRRLSASQNFKSLLFGLAMGGVVMVILSFSFFNERFIAPFITPSRNVSSTPIVIDPTSTEVGSNPLIIIPKINVEVPVVYDVDTIDEPSIQKGLERGVVHYATTSNPGEQGNSVIVGHSSNNLFNSGQYKFAFVLLNRLESGDTITLTKNGKRFVYKVYEKKIVEPTDLSVLGPTERPATVTLITCDPPGTSINRLIIHAEQITPDPATNIASTAQAASVTPAIVPGNAPSLWSRIVSWFSS